MFKRLYFSFFLLISSCFSFSQQTVFLGDDASDCIGAPVDIEVGTNGGIISNTYQLISPTTYALGDDDYTSVINLGFNFEFYGNTYNSFVGSDNGTISFNTALAGQFSQYLVGTIPTNEVTMLNSIMAVWQDLYQPNGGDMYFETIGTAPNRVGVIMWDGFSLFDVDCQTPDQCYTGAILLFEGTNVIETHISNKTSCLAWGGGRGTHGLNNIDGSIGHPVPGRNNTIFSIQNDGYRFTPNGPNDYTVAPIPFSLVSKPNNTSVVWTSTNGDSYPFNNGVLNTSMPNGTVGYFIASSTCGTGVESVSDTTYLTGSNAVVNPTSTPDICFAGVGSLTADIVSGNPPYTFNWPGLGGATTKTVNNLNAGTYTVEVTDNNGCVTTANGVVSDSAVAYPTSTTLVSCTGGSDGTATTEMVPAIGNISYQWNDPNNQTTSTAVGLSAGTYECIITSDIGCNYTVNVTIGEIPEMLIQITNQVDVTCNSGNDGIATVEVTQGTAPYSFNWSGSNATSNTASDLAVGTTTVTVTDDNGCVTTESVILDQPDALIVNAISQDTIICIGDSVRLFAEVGGGSSDYIYEWTSNGVVVGGMNEIYVTPTTASSTYCVTVSEVCGSPTASECVLVEYPDEVDPMLMPDKTGECYPIEVTFDNITNTLETIDYTVWNYSDNSIDTVPGSNSIVHEFGEGFFDVEMEIVTDRGCKYFKNYSNLIEGYSYPEPDFYITPHPASMYNPTVNVISQSSNDIISHKWYAEGGTPNYSTLENPTFDYPTEEKNYPLVLVVENSYGCIDSISKLVRIENDVLLFAPNSFTPDGNGINDTWGISIVGIDVYNFRLEVFNRWGEKIFESFDPQGEWDGTYGSKLAPTGSYIWKIEALDYNNDEKYEFKGTVSILK